MQDDVRKPALHSRSLAIAAIRYPPSPHFMTPASSRPVYTPGIFETPDVAAAKAIILTPEPGTTTEQRWRVETPYLAAQMVQRLDLNLNSLVLDYGCGIGRLSKALIDATGCFVIGVDIAQRMREMAPVYVASPRFMVVSPEGLDVLIERGLQCDFGFAAWVLQHCLEVERDVTRIADGLGPMARFFMVNNLGRAVPTNLGWFNDGKSLEALLAARFDTLDRYPFPPGISAPELTANSALSWWRRKQGGR